MSMHKERKYELLLAWYQIIGGVLGIGFLLWIPITIPFNFIIQYILLIAGLLMHGFSTSCGIILLKEKKNALNLSYINQFFQILKFSILGFGFHYVSGLSIMIGIELSNTKYILEAGASSWRIEWNSDSFIKEINVNIIAILLILLIDHIKKIKSIKEIYSFDIEKEGKIL